MPKAALKSSASGFVFGDLITSGTWVDRSAFYFVQRVNHSLPYGGSACSDRLCRTGRLVRFTSKQGIGTYNKANKAILRAGSGWRGSLFYRKRAEPFEMSETEINNIFHNTPPHFLWMFRTQRKMAMGDLLEGGIRH